MDEQEHRHVRSDGAKLGETQLNEQGGRAFEQGVEQRPDGRGQGSELFGKGVAWRKLRKPRGGKWADA